MKYSLRSSDMDMDSRAGNLAEGAWSVLRRGGDLGLGGVTVAKVSAAPSTEVLAASTSTFLVPDPCLGECSACAGSDWAGECDGEATDVGDLAGVSSKIGSSTGTFLGEGTVAAGDARAGEPKVSSTIAVAL